MNFRALGAAIVSATTLCAAEVPLARIGVMSDIHLTGPESAAAFRRVLDELPTGQPLRIEVSPLNCFGAAGKPIVGEFRADIAANDPTPVDDASPVIRQHE